MQTLPAAIRSVRQRLGLNQAQFSELLGVAQNTLSQYETGRVAPSLGVLYELFRHAQDEEQLEPIVEALNRHSVTLDKLTEQDVQDALRLFDEYVKSAEARRTRGNHRDLRAEFASLARQIVSGLCPINGAIVDLLRLWTEYAHNPGATAPFSEVIGFLRVNLSQSGSPRSAREQPAPPKPTRPKKRKQTSRTRKG